MGQETAITLFPALGSYIVSDTLEGGQYRNTDLPTMLSTGRGPLKMRQHIKMSDMLKLKIINQSPQNTTDLVDLITSWKQIFISYFIVTSYESRNYCCDCLPTRTHNLRVQAAKTNTEKIKTQTQS